ncbi:MAG: arginase [Alphaproteobacteria bacterium]
MADRILNVEVIGFDSGWGCRDFRTEDGPHQLRAHTCMATLRDCGVKPVWRGPLGLKFLGNHAELNTKEKTLPNTLASLRRLSGTVKRSVEQGNIPVVIGGDHSSAIGTWSGAVEATKSNGKFGLIWLDAHLDSHTYDTSYQGKWGGWWHGQPVTAILGHGLQQFRQLGGLQPKISAQHLSIIGPHSFEPAEEEFVRANGVRVYYLAEVEARGFKACYDEALARATTGTDAFGLTIDLDAFRPEDSPGVGSPEDKGLKAADVLPALRSIGWQKGFRALEIAEFNPHQDKGGKTVQLIEKLMENVFTKPSA